MERLSRALFEAAGATPEDAAVTTAILVRTSLWGIDSHGVRAIPRYLQRLREGKLQSPPPIQVLRETSTTAMWDCRNGIGYVCGDRAMAAAIRKAKQHAIGCVSTMGTGHIGGLFHYVTMATEQDLIGIVTNRGGGHNVAPFGGTRGVLGVNPFAIGVPVGVGHPLVLDIATTYAASGHLLVMQTRGEPIPDGWLIGPDGDWVHERSKIYEGAAAMVPFGAHKGYGISVFIEALAAFGCDCGVNAQGFGITYTTIDPEGFCPIADFKARIDSLVQQLKAVPPRPGFAEILVPGEHEWRTEARRRRDGIFVDAPFWKDMVASAVELDVEIDDLVV
jgi:uncharacterized oxidoreductase